MTVTFPSSGHGLKFGAPPAPFNVPTIRFDRHSNDPVHRMIRSTAVQHSFHVPPILTFSLSDKNWNRRKMFPIKMDTISIPSAEKVPLEPGGGLNKLGGLNQFFISDYNINRLKILCFPRYIYHRYTMQSVYILTTAVRKFNEYWQHMRCETHQKQHFNQNEKVVSAIIAFALTREQ